MGLPECSVLNYWAILGYRNSKALNDSQVLFEWISARLISFNGWNPLCLKVESAANDSSKCNRIHNRLSFIGRKPSGSHKIWKTKLKKHKFFEIGQELVRPAHLKAQWSEFFEDLNQIKTNQNKWKSMTFLLFYM